MFKGLTLEDSHDSNSFDHSDMESTVGDQSTAGESSTIGDASTVGKSNSWTDDDDASTVVSTSEISTLEFLSSMLVNPFAGAAKVNSSDVEDDDDDDSLFTDENGNSFSDTDESRVLAPLRVTKRFSNKKDDKKRGNTKAEETSQMSLNGRMRKLRLGNKTTSTSRDYDDQSFHSEGSSEYYTSTFDDDSAGGGGENENMKANKKKMDMNESILSNLSLTNVPQKVDYYSDSAILYRAIDTKEWDEAGRILHVSPKMARNWVYRTNEHNNDVVWMFLPIHAACFSGAPVNLIRDLVNAYPKSASVAAPGEKLPVHIACETGASHEVVAVLVETFSESLYHVDSSGNTPLQLCVFSMSGKNRSKVMKVLTSAAAGTGTGPKKSRFRKFINIGKRKNGNERMASEC
uniref:Uncharacterized protein n=1 Tax=Chaetoceros debilis TaxID=122233 RepID=A0A7S3Q5H3_9STRA